MNKNAVNAITGILLIAASIYITYQQAYKDGYWRGVKQQEITKQGCK